MCGGITLGLPIMQHSMGLALVHRCVTGTIRNMMDARCHAATKQLANGIGRHTRDYGHF